MCGEIYIDIPFPYINNSKLCVYFSTLDTNPSKYI